MGSGQNPLPRTCGGEGRVRGRLLLAALALALPTAAAAALPVPALTGPVVDQAGCASCHTLKDAGATGTVGPNLDQTKPPLELVVDRVTNGKGAMPAFGSQLSQQQIADVAAYVVQATQG